MNGAVSQKRPAVGVGVVILRVHEGQQEALLIRRRNPPRQDEWSIPGGHQEWGETVREAAAREAMEEVGLKVTDLKLIGVYDGIMRKDGLVDGHWTLVDFRADWAGDEAKAGDDAREVAWVPVADLEKLGLWRETMHAIRTAAAMGVMP